MSYLRLTDNDTRLGFITIGERSKTWRPLGISIESGDDEHAGCSILLRAAGWTVRIALLDIVQPYRRKVRAGSWDAATVARLGRDWYYDVHRREFGFMVSEGALHLRYGPQTGDSATAKSKCYFMPWRQWRHVRHSVYGLQGERICDESDYPAWLDFHAAREKFPTVEFLIEDFDGARIKATTRIEEREWRFGDKWCSWLSLFRRPKIVRSLGIAFDAEVGKEKGSWKGGLVGHAVDMVPGELHEAAFRRYCEQDVQSRSGNSRITFVGRLTT